MKGLPVSTFISFCLLVAQFTTQADEPIPRLDGGGALKSVFLIVCDSAPNKVILLDDTGRWIHRIKEAEIKIDGSQVSTVKCTMYEGNFRPTQPEIKTWRLSQLKTVSEAEFQSMVDGLQTDPEAVKKRLSMGTPTPPMPEKPVEKPAT